MQEKVVIVNDSDEVVGSKKRSEVDYSKDIYRVAALWLTNSKGEILIAQRKLTKDKDPGMWGPAVAGTVEEGESYEENIYKETEEEIGLTGITLEKGPKQRVSSPRNHFTQWFRGVLDKNSNEFSIQEDEVEKVRWISRETLESELHKNPSQYLPNLPAILKLFYE